MIKTKNTQAHKHVVALAAALAMTMLIGVAMLAFGINALLNKNVVTTVQAAGLTSADPVADQASTDKALIDQLQAQISEYQSRESQYQTELKDAADQINQLRQQDQQYQFLLNALQNAGVIRITSDGRVLLPNPQNFPFDREGNDN